MKDFSYLIGANFTDPKTGRCAWTNQSSSQGPLGIKLLLTSPKGIETWLAVQIPTWGRSRGGSWQATHDSLTRISPSDFALLYEMMGGSLYISLSSDWSWIKCHSKKGSLRSPRGRLVASLQSPFHPCFYHLYHHVIFCTKSYYVICFDCFLCRRFQVRQGTCGKFLRNLHGGQFLPQISWTFGHTLSPSDTTMIQAPPVKRYWAQGSQ